MRFLVLSLLSIIAVSSASDVPVITDADDEEVVALWECIRKALDGGLESAKIPNHNPFVFNHDLEIPLAVGDIILNITLTHVEIDDIADFVVETMKGTYLKDTHEVVYAFDFKYNKMSFVGDYSSTFQSISTNVSSLGSGKFNITFKDLHLFGESDLNTETVQLDNFTMKILVGDVEIHIEGLGLLEPIVNLAGGSLLKELTNDNIDAISAAASPGIQERLNTQWLDAEHLYRVQAMVDACGGDHRKLFEV